MRLRIPRLEPETQFLVLAAAVGACGALGNEAFRAAIRYAHRVFHGRTEDLLAPIGPGIEPVLVVLIPILGGLAVGLLRRITGQETMTSDLTYDLRSGDPDSLDHMVAITFANIALDLVGDGVSGRMVAIRDGRYTHTAIPDPSLGPRKVDVASLYNEERYRPNYDHKLGAPLLLGTA